MKTITVSETANYVNVQTHTQLDMDFKKEAFRANQLWKEMQTILKRVHLRRFKGEQDFGIIFVDLMFEI